MQRKFGLVSATGPVIAGLAALLIATAASAESKKNGPAKIESIEGSNVKRVTLTAKAAQRIGLKTTPTREEMVVRHIMVLGEVEGGPGGEPAVATQTPATKVTNTPEPDGAPEHTEVAANSAAADAGVVRVRVLLPTHGQKVAGWQGRGESQDDNDAEDDFGDDDDEDSAEIVPQSDGADEMKPLKAKLVVMAKKADAKAASKELYFAVEPGGHRLVPGQHVGVRLALSGGNTPKKVVPYSAVVYDASGDAWLYTNPEPLVFIRHRLAIEHIEGELAVLKDGPAAGTEVVTVGAAELFGAEVGVGH